MKQFEEILQAYYMELINIPYEKLNEWQLYVLGSFTTKESFCQYNDVNNVSGKLAMQFFRGVKTRGVQPLDVIAQNCTEFNNESEVEPGEVAQFMLDVANGYISTRKTTDLQIKLAKKYKELTGKSIKN